mgnify:CR=1 FL=1|tara:strand:- start:5965 stop:6456 length:492 start_codon:yes stop_codon:yes gene_type:complete
MDQISKKYPKNTKKEAKELFGYSLEEFELVNNVQVGEFQTGDIGLFQYKVGATINQKFLVLCVSNARSGIIPSFMSSKKNPLLSTFRIDHLSQETIALIVGALHKSVTPVYQWATYSRFTGFLGKVLGKENYRTFDKTKMSSISIVEVKYLKDKRETLKGGDK